MTGVIDTILARCEPEGGCLVWTGPKTPSGYGKLRIDGRLTYVHRAVYELLVAPIPPGMEIDHLCRTRGCADVNHLEVVTPAENKRRRVLPPLKTHCPRGHPYAGANLYEHRGQRNCRACMAEANRRHALKRHGR